MGFYKSIAEHYDQIFPFNKAQLNFVLQSLKNPKGLSVLDIGCGTGNLSFELSKHFKKVIAIDLDEAMLEKARQKSTDRIQFLSKDMLIIEKEFGQNTFDAVICFGNTLVHLDGPESILDFFIQSRKILKNNGKLLLQTINYDRIIEQEIKGLPTIENDKIMFVRNYRLHTDQKTINFETILTVKDSGQQIINAIRLYPLRNVELINLLMQAGFKDIFFYKNFNRDVITGESIPLVVEAR